MGRILIQPTLDTLEDYTAFAEENDFDFEIVDFAFPAGLTGDYMAVVEEYRQRGPAARLVAQHGAFMDLYLNSFDSDVRNIAERRYLANMEIARELNLKYVIFHTNLIPLIKHEVYRQRWVEAQAAFWLARLEEFPVTVLLENMWDPDPFVLSDLLAAVGSNRLKVCFDTGHFNIFSGVPMREWFETLGNDIVYIHLNDNMGDVDNEMAAGDGTVDWAEFDRLVREFCDAPHIVLELSDMERLQRTLAYLQAEKIYPFG